MQQHILHNYKTNKCMHVLPIVWCSLLYTMCHRMVRVILLGEDCTNQRAEYCSTGVHVVCPVQCQSVGAHMKPVLCIAV